MRYSIPLAVALALSAAAPALAAGPDQSAPASQRFPWGVVGLVGLVGLLGARKRSA